MKHESMRSIISGGVPTSLVEQDLQSPFLGVFYTSVLNPL